jgi:hypothetical protein
VFVLIRVDDFYEILHHIMRGGKNKTESGLGSLVVRVVLCAVYVDDR